ncbi:MAG TPA: RNA polymerase sigma factor [Verrucomicrobiota bacterium]|nr:RNA polymerase sigma factor [Verrucomicrobiota bacterium]
MFDQWKQLKQDAPLSGLISCRFEVDANHPVVSIPRDTCELADGVLQQNVAEGRYREAFEVLVTEYRDRIFRLAFGILQDEHTAEDMTQEILLRIWKGLPGYRRTASISTWVYAISRNVCISELKRRAARPIVSMSAPAIQDAIDSAANPDTPSGEPGRALDVQALLGKLPEHYRRVLVLFYLEDKSYNAVADMLGIPLGTVKTYLHRAKHELLKLIRRENSRANL